MSRLSRVTESAPEIVDSIFYVCIRCTYVSTLSILINFECWENVLQESGRIVKGNYATGLMDAE